VTPAAVREVCVWTCAVAALRSELRNAEQWLSAAERERAARFRFAADRQRYVAAHGHLRAVLAELTGTAPAALVLAADPRGKPALASPRGTGLEFNLSHSGELVLVATARDLPVGIDVEQARALDDDAALAARILAAEELARWQALEVPARPAFLLAAWARKEALLKAAGLGLAREPAELTLRPARPGRWAAELDGTGWSVHELAVPRGYHAAVAARGGDWRIVRSELADRGPR
jgi:4'-phosphopantetheinyl transferase